MANRLAQETSPYLLQHQHNPVDWYPWGPEAFQASQSQNKPIFLSVGYSTCYWCHVMERQCFEVEPIAAVMNRLFINIKVDREERPDVDQLYMTAVQLLTRQGGWPMSVFLLPGLRPFYGGTYFPPNDSHGRPGFPRLLQALHDAFVNRRSDVEKTAADLTQAIIDITDRPERMDAKQPATIDRNLVNRLIDYAASDYDPQFGGFGSAPKFPRETLLQLLLSHHGRSHETQLGNRIRHTLDAMANGGIRDQLGGGFHRYSTDAHWLVPHFEIMLYDNAMLAWVYAEAFRQFSDHRYARIARGICDFVLREMTDSAGSFYTAFDAEVDGFEGQNYLWTESEIITALGPEDARQFIALYGIDQGPNFADPHNGNGVAESNILYLPSSAARDLTAEIDPRMIAARATLLSIRKERKQPLLDTKILTSWNGLMIQGLAHAGEVLSEPRYTAAANLAADWLLANHVGSDRTLQRTSRSGGPARLNGSLDDYAFLIQSLLSLKRQSDAARLMKVVREQFFDVRTGSYFFTDNQRSELFARQKVITDSPLPSGNGIIAQVLIELGEMEQAANLLASVAGAMQHDSGSMSALLLAADNYVEAAGSLTIGNHRSISEFRDVPASPIDMRAAWQSDRIVEITVQIADGYHINSHDPSADLVKTELIATPPAKIDYPASTEVSDGLQGYGGAIKLLVTWKQPPAAKVRLLLRYQPCTDSACLAATSKIIELSPSSLQR